MRPRVMAPALRMSVSVMAYRRRMRHVTPSSSEMWTRIDQHEASGLSTQWSSRTEEPACTSTG